MAKERGTSWTVRPRTAGIVGAFVIGIASVLFLSQSGWLGLPGTGLSEAVPAPPIKRVALEDRTVVLGMDKTDGGATIESLAVSQQPEVGRLRVTTGHTLVYAPPPDFNGKVSAGFETCWTGLGCGTRLVAITVKAVNDAPIARADTAITGQGKAVAINVLANDSDPDGDRLTIRPVARSRSGGRMRVTGSWIVWTPQPRFRGAATIRYTAMDRHGGTSRASVTIRVGPSTIAPSTSPAVIKSITAAGPAAADQPRDPFLQPLPPPAENASPRAARDRVSVPEGGTVIIDVLANDRDPDGDRLSIASVDVPTGGVAKQVGDRIQFSAPSTSAGDISFGYSVVDSAGATGWSLVSVVVLRVNHTSNRGSSSRSP